MSYQYFCMSWCECNVVDVFAIVVVVVVFSLCMLKRSVEKSFLKSHCGHWSVVSGVRCTRTRNRHRALLNTTDVIRQYGSMGGK